MCLSTATPAPRAEPPTVKLPGDQQQPSMHNGKGVGQSIRNLTSSATQRLSSRKALKDRSSSFDPQANLCRKSFQNLKDDVDICVDVRKDEANDDEAHDEADPGKSIEERLEFSHSFTIEEGFEVPSLDLAPTKSSLCRKQFRAAVGAVILMRRLGSIVGANAKDSTIASSGASSGDGKSIKFSTVHVRTYHMTLGDHPGCRKGHPLCLDWTFEEYKPTPVDEYERKHPVRRPVKKLYIEPEKRRHYLLHECKIPMNEMIRARKEVLTIQKNRKKSQKDAEKDVNSVLKTLEEAKRKMVASLPTGKLVSKRSQRKRHTIAKKA